MAPTRRIGVIGGMGPEATIAFMARVVARTPADDDADHVPMIVDSNTQVPSRIAHIIEGTGKDPAPVLAAMAHRLEKAGAEALAMPCNTAHSYAAAVRAASALPFIDMVELTADRVAGSAAARVGILASPAVRRTAIFDRAFAARGIATLYPCDEAPILAAIRAIKRSSADPAARASLDEAAAELAAVGADCLVVGCSEFSIVASSLVAAVPVVDSLDVLADAVIAFAKGAPAVRAPAASTTQPELTDAGGR